MLKAEPGGSSRHQLLKVCHLISLVRIAVRLHQEALIRTFIKEDEDLCHENIKTTNVMFDSHHVP